MMHGRTHVNDVVFATLVNLLLSRLSDLRVRTSGSVHGPRVPAGSTGPSKFGPSKFACRFACRVCGRLLAGSACMVRDRAAPHRSTRKSTPKVHADHADEGGGARHEMAL